MSLEKLLQRMTVLNKTNVLERRVATTMLGVTADRIFTQGKAQDESTETYSKEYIKQRVRDGYPASSKVIFQATRQMANDFSVINQGNEIGLGFKNQTNADKSEWVEATYEKSVFAHTNGELALIDKLVDKEVQKILNV